MARRKKIAAAVILTLAAAVICIFLNAVRSPIPSGASIAQLIDFKTDMILRVPSGRELWQMVRTLPCFKRCADSKDGKLLIQSSALADRISEINTLGTVTGMRILDIFDFVGDENVVALDASSPTAPNIIFLSRLSPTASVLLELYLRFGNSEVIRTATGRMHVRHLSDRNLLWTKFGNVLALSNDVGLLTQAKESALHRGNVSHAAELASASNNARVVLNLPQDCRPSACALTLTTGPAAGFGRRSDFMNTTAASLPVDTSAGVFLRVPSRQVWKDVLSYLPQPLKVKWRIFIEDRLAAVMNFDNFEADIVDRFTGESAVFLSNQVDPWLTLAAGHPVPTIALVLSVKTDPEFERRLTLALHEFAEVIQEDSTLHVDVVEENFDGQIVHALKVQRFATVAEAGFFITPVNEHESLLFVSTSTGWLGRAVDVRSGRNPGAIAQPWLRAAISSFGERDDIAGFINFERLGSLPQFTKSLNDPGGRLGVLMRATGTASVNGTLDADNAARCTLRLWGQ